MHPEILQDAPGQCPICGMDLVPVGASSGAATIEIDPTVVQNMGVRTAKVAHGPIFRQVRAVGEIEVGEDQLSVVNLRFSGWVDKLVVERTGDRVSRGQVLFEVFSPELVAAQEELLLAVKGGGPVAAAARERLLNWGLDPRDVAAIEQSGTTRRALPVRAPQDGYVLSKEVVQGARVEAGMDLYRIGNLTKIWVTADIYEFDAPFVEVGQPAQMELAFERGTTLQGKVAYVYPTLDPMRRTLKVRLEFDNPGLRLKPGMFATVYVQVQRTEDALLVPTEAILPSGTRDVVFVVEGDGRFLARDIRTGLRGEHHLTEVISGLEPGERVVVSGQFLLDSESSLREAVQKLMGHDHRTTPHTAPPEPADPAPAGDWVCPMHPEVRSDEPGRCPKCGMFLEKVPE
jgi:multidrug efflux pump subunit AcrA (membrane-fusion protein)